MRVITGRRRPWSCDGPIQPARSAPAPARRTLADNGREPPAAVVRRRTERGGTVRAPAGRRTSGRRQRRRTRAAAHPGGSAPPGQDEGIEIVDFRFCRPARPDAALLGAGARADRGRLRGGLRLRRLVDPGLPGDPGVGHAAGPRPQHRGDRPVPRAQDAEPQLLRAGPGDRGVVLPRPPLHRQEGRGLPEVHRHRRHRLLRPRGRVLHLQRRALRPGPDYGYYQSTRSRGSGTRASDEGPNLGYKPRYKEGYFPVPPDGPLPGSALRDDPHHGAARHRDRGAAPRGGDRRPGRDRHALRHAARRWPTS